MGCPPAPVYKGARGEAAGLGGGRAKGESYSVVVGEGKGEGEGRKGAPPLPSPIRTSPWGGVRPPFGAFLSFPIWPIKGHCFPRRIPVTLRYSEKYPNHSEPFSCPNIAFQYIDIYVSTISRLLVTSMISSGTLNKLWSSNHITHNTNRHRTLSVRTLRVRELCRHDRDTSPFNNQ